jgi:hypothetical protein
MSSDLGSSQDNDDSYNRIRIPGDLKSQIYLQIADSSESVPLQEEEEDGTTFTPTAVQKTPTASSTKSSGASRLNQSILSSDFPTPTPERPNPLEQVPTAKDNGTGETPSPVRSHEVGSTHTQPLAGRISNMITEEDTDLEGDDPSVSRQTTSSRQSGDGKRPKMPGRPSTMRRIGSAIKKTMSNNKESKS